MLRRTPIKPGRGFTRKLPPPRQCKQVSPDWKPRPREAAAPRSDGRARMVVQVPKSEPVRHEGYRRLVAALPCILCGVPNHSQAAHPNTGKGAGIKTDDRECFPLCADMPRLRGCHWRFDQAALFTKPERRRLEPVWGFATRTAVRLAGAWPADLEPWPEDEEATA